MVLQGPAEWEEFNLTYSSALSFGLKNQKNKRTARQILELFVFNHTSVFPFILYQTQPDADVLAIQPQNAAQLPGDHRNAPGGAASHLPGGLLLLQWREQAPGDGGLWPGHGEHGEHSAGSIVLLPEGTVFGQGRGGVHGPEGQLRGAPHPFHTHERWKVKWTNSGAAAVQPLLTAHTLTTKSC